jgi:hypothetical protein
MNDLEKFCQEVEEFRLYRTRCIRYMKIFGSIALVIYIICIGIILT